MTLLVMSTCFYPKEDFYVRMLKSAQRNGLNPYLLGLGATQVSGHTGDEQGPRVIEFLKTRSEDYVLCCDAPDVLFLADQFQIMTKFAAYLSPMVVSAEDSCFPCLPELEVLRAIPGRHKFVNIGLWMGERQHCIDTLQKSIDLYRHKNVDPQNDLDNPQAWMARGLAAGTLDFALDRNCILFQSMGSPLTNTDVVIKDGKVFNQTTGTYPIAIHYNGHACMGMGANHQMFKTLYGEL